jgi:hypothetical protein
MTGELAKQVRAMIDLLNQRCVDEATAWYAPDATIVQPGGDMAGVAAQLGLM